VELEALTGGRNSVLVISGSVLVRNYLNAALTAERYAVLSAANEEEAREVLRAFPGQIQVLAVVMARAPSAEIARRLTDENPGLRAVIVSPGISAKLTGLADGSEPPCAPRELVGAIKRAFSGEQHVIA
jgi:DNA-binding NtrC family response regulator